VSACGAAEEQEQPAWSRAPSPGPDAGLPRRLRIRRSSDFRAVFERGRSYAGARMVLWTAGTKDAACRLGVVASRKAFRRAVDRSRAKRLLRETFRLNRSRLSGGHDMVLVARRGMAGCGRGDVEQEFLALTRQAGLLKDLGAGEGNRTGSTG